MAAVLFFFAANFGCKKNENQAAEAAQTADGTVQQRDIFADSYQIGAAKPNPYEVENMRQAYNNLFEPDISTLLPNYRYYRFAPSLPEHMRILLQSKLELFDYPLHHEIIERGESYHDPAIADPSYTYYYCVIKVGDLVPNVPNVVIADLALVPDESRLAQEAFRLTGASFQTPDVFVPNPALVGGTFKFTLPDPGGTDPNPPTENPPSGAGCGCPTTDHQRKPSGCVRVEDDKLNTMVGVPNVEVRVSKDQFFGDVFVKEDETDANGCWMIDKKYHGSIHIRVKYESDLCNVKVMKGSADIDGYTFPHQSYEGVFWGPNYQGIELKHMTTATLNSTQYRRWIASTCNANLFDYNAFCTGAGINKASNNLKILITPLSDSGATPMLDKGGITFDVILAGAVIGAAAVIGRVFGLQGAVFAGLGGTIIAVAAPDVVFNFTSVPKSDQARQLFNHEFSHVSHFEKVGSSYWLGNLFYALKNEVTGNNSPYGTPTTPGSGKCAIIETWAELMDNVLTDARYGFSHSNGTPLNENTYAAKLEKRLFEGGNSPIFFPSGWYFDLIDNNPLNPFLADEPLNVTDNVKNYSPLIIFGAMTSSVITLPQLRDAINTPAVLSSTGNSSADFVTLAAPYGL